MLDTGDIDEKNARMQKKRMDQSVTQCYVEELLAARTSEGIKIILKKIGENNRSAIAAKKTLLEANDKGVKLLCKFYPELTLDEQKQTLQLLGEIQSRASVELPKKDVSGNDQIVAVLAEILQELRGLNVKLDNMEKQKNKSG